MLTSDSGSVWNIGSDLYVGNNGGAGNSLMISNNAAVYDGVGWVGRSSNGNTVHIADGGYWGNKLLFVGFQGSSNSLVVAGGSVVVSFELLVGNYSEGCNNIIQLDSGTLVVTNQAADAVLDVWSGKIILNGGVLHADKLAMTNSCARFVRNGGTLIVSSLVLDPSFDADGDGIPNGYEQGHGLDPLNAADANLDNDGDGISSLQEYLAGTDPTNSASAFRILSVVATNNDVRVTWNCGGGRTNVVESATDLAGSYTNVSPNIILPGSGDVTTNWLYAGAATNGVGRFYRIRLVP